ncbi:MAG: CDP-alcohol phosphatidyltransferase family protein [Blastocatellia bacterium]
MEQKKILAWGVHLYTGLGLVLSAGMAVLLVHGGENAFRLTFALMFIATVIDTTDGWLARKARVWEVLPGFDGRRLDDLIDFNTYTTLPLLLIWRAGLLSGDNQWWLLLPLLASAYGFCQTNAKTDDHFFVGFPSYWNITAFYLYLLQPPEWATLALIITLALLTFVPVRYLYTTHGGRLSLVTNLFGAAWALSLLLIFLQWGHVPLPYILVTLSFPIWYTAMSWIISIRYWRDKALARS